MDKNEKLIQIFENEAFKKAAENLASVDDLRQLFADYGLELSNEEVTELCVQIGRQMESGELTDADLENVAGGFWLAVGAIALGIGCIGAFAMGVYNGYKSKK